MAEMNPLRRRMIEDMTVRNLSPATQHPSGAIHHELRQSAPPPICPQNQAPRQRATPLGPGHTERPTVCIESAKIAVDRPASCSRRSPDHAETW